MGNFRPPTHPFLSTWLLNAPLLYPLHDGTQITTFKTLIARLCVVFSNLEFRGKFSSFEVYNDNPEIEVVGDRPL